jgi:hypothetical protein
MQPGLLGQVSFFAVAVVALTTVAVCSVLGFEQIQPGRSGQVLSDFFPVLPAKTAALITSNAATIPKPIFFFILS